MIPSRNLNISYNVLFLIGNDQTCNQGFKVLEIDVPYYLFLFLLWNRVLIIPGTRCGVEAVSVSRRTFTIRPNFLRETWVQLFWNNFPKLSPEKKHITWKFLFYPQHESDQTNKWFPVIDLPQFCIKFHKSLTTSVRPRLALFSVHICRMPHCLTEQYASLTYNHNCLKWKSFWGNRSGEWHGLLKMNSHIENTSARFLAFSLSDFNK